MMKTTEMDRKMNKTKSLIVIVLPVLMFLFGYGFTTSADANPDRSPSPLATVPGLARDHEGELRDDTIALYETFQAEVGIGLCMRAKGHIYRPELSFPPEFAVAISQDLDISLASIEANGGPLNETARDSGRQRNRKYVDAMSRSAKNSYYMDLLGESLEDVEFVNRASALPQGRTDFATGGCVGKVNEARSGVYDLRSEVNETARSERAKMHSEQNVGCSHAALAHITSIEQYEEEYDAVQEAVGAAGVEQCEAELAEQASAISLRADEAAYEKHSKALDRHSARYSKMLEKAKNDRSFKAFLESEYPAAVDATLSSDSYLDE
jgi:hypothetical protein